VGEMLKKASKLVGGENSLKEKMIPVKKAGGGAMKTKGYAKGGAAMKTKGAAKGGIKKPSSKKTGLFGRR